MAEFKTNVPVVQKESVVTVDVARDAPMPVGAHRFRLVVVDDSGNESEPAFIDVVIIDTEKPTAILDVVDANGRRIEPTVPAGTSFILSAARSSDVAPGKIREYQFTLLDRV
jgi:hypothetical protein